MTRIYLASKSKARKELLESLGLKFKVLPSAVEEIGSVKGISYIKLVKLNALKKAEDVAAKVKDGVVIAADTIMVQHNKIFGKPKDLKDAIATLKAMSGKTQTVYTGLAVIEKKSGRVIVDYEKTRVYMDKLSDKEIRAYFEKVSPLDKAGSFDIQGKGAFFIRRIEGCFYNVVGLPLRKLYRIFKQFGITNNIFCFLFSVFCFLSLSGCSTEYNIVTGEQELYYYNTDKEVQMGKAIAKQVEKEMKPVEDPLVQKRVEDIGKKIAAVCDRKEINYYFYVLNEDDVNAFSLPGGYVFIYKGLVDKVSNDDELAGVIGHEVSHIVARHSIKRLQGQQLYSVLRVLTAAAPSMGDVGAAADVAITQLILGYSREDELLADQLGTRYARLAGYDPNAMITFLKKLQEVQKRRPLAPISYFKTHPYVPDRIRIVKEELGKGMNFNDYINIQDQPHK
ncbi:MAG: Maf and M48 domain-containing protein [Candidatus Omnitrophota bacterium]|nr:Maf and M48 domain-containing protein [Candidatus Omnitrophota bacterium]